MRLALEVVLTRFSFFLFSFSFSFLTLPTRKAFFLSRSLQRVKVFEGRKRRKVIRPFAKCLIDITGKGFKYSVFVTFKMFGKKVRYYGIESKWTTRK